MEGVLLGNLRGNKLQLSATNCIVLVVCVCDCVCIYDCVRVCICVAVGPSIYAVV
jgi:hypothetical protein